jgi:uncharacterized protein YcfJ
MRGLVPPVAAVLLLAGCASLPAWPTVMVLPGDQKSFKRFQVDDEACRRWAGQHAGAEGAKDDRVLSGAAIGTAVGAAAGAAIGAAAGSPGTGVAAGAGAGLLGGSAIGASRADLAHGSLQRRYDVAYMQCM